MLFVGGPNAYNKSKMADGKINRRRPISAVRPIATKFGAVNPNEPCCASS